MKMVLIDRRRMSQLMIENNLGVKVKDVFEVKQVDTDYFYWGVTLFYQRLHPVQASSKMADAVLV